MVPAPFRVVLDANVLFPFTVRDTLRPTPLRTSPNWELGISELDWTTKLH